jgi:hypothetical protein
MVLQDIRRALRSSLGFGLVFLVIALVNAAGSGGLSTARLGLTHWQLDLPVLYIGGALVVGVVIGVCKPLTRTLPGAMVVGCLIAFPLTVALSPIGMPGSAWRVRLEVSAWIALVLGPLYTWAVWSKPATNAPGTGRGE